MSKTWRFWLKTCFWVKLLTSNKHVFAIICKCLTLHYLLTLTSGWSWKSWKKKAIFRGFDCFLRAGVHAFFVDGLKFIVLYHPINYLTKYEPNRRTLEIQLEHASFDLIKIREGGKEMRRNSFLKIVFSSNRRHRNTTYGNWKGLTLF